MASVVISGDSSGTITLSAPSVAGSNTITMPASTGTVALTSNVIGVGQTWQNVTSSRTYGTTYTNSTGKPIVVNVSVYGNINNDNQLKVDGVIVCVYDGGSYANSITITLSAIVPAGSTYQVTASSGTPTITYWAELR
jgi:hypothetical protein